MLDLREQTDALWPELEKAVHDVIRSGRYVLGPVVEAFEREIADYLGTRHAVGLNSGTDALVIALRALDVGPGDEVVTPSFTFFATVEAISVVGATPVFCDIEPASLCLDPRSVERALGPRTRAIIPVHLFGHSAEMDALLDLAAQRGVAVLEDACQAIGARHDGRRVGGLGRVGAFSFFPSKNLGALGDGGLLVTDDAGLAERARRLRDHGSAERYHNVELGYASRLDEFQAAILRVKLPYLDAWNDARREVARRYSEGLAGVAGLQTPEEGNQVRHVYHQYTIRVTGGRRERVRSALDEAGVSTQVYYPIPVHAMPMYAHLGARLPVTERACEEVLSLPIWPELDEPTQRCIVEALLHAAASRE